MPDDAPRNRDPIDEPATLATQNARQGETSGRMRYVLGISLLVAFIVIVGLAFEWNQARTPTSIPPATNAQQTAPGAPQPHGEVPGNTTPTPPTNNSQGGGQ